MLDRRTSTLAVRSNIRQIDRPVPSSLTSRPLSTSPPSISAIPRISLASRFAGSISSARARLLIACSKLDCPRYAWACAAMTARCERHIEFEERRFVLTYQVGRGRLFRF